MKLKPISVAAKIVGVPVSRIRNAIRSGVLKTLPLGGVQLVNMDEVLVWVQGQRTGSMMSYQELSDYIGMTVSALRRSVREGWLPYRQIGKQHFFDKDEVVKAITERMR